MKKLTARQQAKTLVETFSKSGAINHIDQTLTELTKDNYGSSNINQISWWVLVLKRIKETV